MWPYSSCIFDYVSCRLSPSSTSVQLINHLNTPQLGIPILKKILRYRYPKKVSRERRNHFRTSRLGLTTLLCTWHPNERVTEINLKEMWGMFDYAISFNSDVSAWDVSRVTDMGSMFHAASKFAQHLCLDIPSSTETGGIFTGTAGACINKTCGSVVDSSLYC